MRAQFPASPDDIDLAALAAKARPILPQLCIATLAIGALSCAGLSMLTPKYVAQAQIAINPFAPHRDLSVRMDEEAIATHVRALQSSGLALKLAADLGLTARPEFNAALVRRGPIGRALHLVGLVGPRAGQSEQELVRAACADALRVYQIKDTREIMIEFRSSDPGLAAAAANKLAELYRDDLSQRAILESSDARARLAPHIKKLAEEVAAAEAEVARLRGNIFDGGRDKSGLDEQQLAEHGELTKAARASAEAKTRAAQAGADDAQLRALEILAKSKRAQFAGLQAQLESVHTTSEARAVPVEVEIVSRARPPSDAAWPKVGPMVGPMVGMVTLLATTATLLLGLALGLTRELFAMTRAAPRTAATGDGRPAPAATNGRRPARSVPSLARQLIAGATGRTGFRTLVTGEGAGRAAGGVAIALALQLANRKQQVILLDWSLDGVGLAFELGVSPTLGMSDVLSGRASFEDVIERLAQSDAHIIAAGSSAAGIAAALDKDRVNMLLDALDDAYDHVVIVGGRDALRDLFTTIGGRIDAGVVVAGGKGAAPEGNFLGFNVADLDVIRYEPGAQEWGEAYVLTASGAGA